MDDRPLTDKPRASCMETGGGRAPAGRLMRLLRRSARYAAAGYVWSANGPSFGYSAPALGNARPSIPNCSFDM